MALPLGNFKTGTGKAPKLHYLVTHHRGLRGARGTQLKSKFRSKKVDWGI